MAGLPLADVKVIGQKGIGLTGYRADGYAGLVGCAGWWW